MWDPQVSWAEFKSPMMRYGCGRPKMSWKSAASLIGSFGGKYKLQTVNGNFKCTLTITAWSGILCGIFSEWKELWMAVSTPPLAGPSVSLSLR